MAVQGRVKLTTPTTVYPVTRAEMKAHLRVQTTVDDEYIDGIIRATHNVAQDRVNRSLMSQTWTMTLDDFPSDDGPISLRRPPISSSATDLTVTYVNTTGGSTTLSATAYTVDSVSEPGRLTLSTGVTQWPDTSTGVNSVTITYVAGYPLSTLASTATTPQEIKMWMKSRGAQMYDFRSPVENETLNFLRRDFVDGLLDQYRIKEVV